MKNNLLLITILILSACGGKTETGNTETTSDQKWFENATIYEVNLRQHTREGTIEAFAKDVPRLKELGVDVLWFMPVQPIGKLKRKAVGDTFVEDLPNPDYTKYWGSPYSISDYMAVNPRYGSVAEFKDLVKKCHDHGIKVMLDWVANHTAWDSDWVTEHPEWYTKDSSGEITDPIGEDGKSWGWTDVADLNYDNAAMRKEMIKSMQFWVNECNIDGFRCDVAMEVPTDFWNEARMALDKIKPMFMLAESEAHKPDHFKQAFDAYYGWEMHHVMNKIYKGEAQPTEIIRVANEKDSICGSHVFPMNFITNHDENSWNGTIDERLGESWKAMAVLSYALRGMPLIYSGQDAGLNHRLKFFEKDSIDWDNPKAPDYFTFYKQLNEVKSDAAFGAFSPITYQIDENANEILIIDRGASMEYRVILNLSKGENQISDTLKKELEGYESINENGWNTGNAEQWGYALFKKK